MILQYKQLAKHVFNVTAFLIHDTLQTTLPLSELWSLKRRGSARHSSTI